MLNGAWTQQSFNFMILHNLKCVSLTLNMHFFLTANVHLSTIQLHGRIVQTIPGKKTNLL